MDYNYYGIIDRNCDKSKIEFYEKYYDYIVNAIKTYDKKAIIKILPELVKNNDFCGEAFDIFKLIYLNPHLREYIFYMLHKGHVTPEELEGYMLDNILKKTNWGFEYVINNLDRVLSDEEPYQIREKIEIIINYIKEDKYKYDIFLEKILESSISKIRYVFISYLLKKRLDITEDIIIKALYKYPDEYQYKQETMPFFSNEPELLISKIPSLIITYNNKCNKINFFKTSFLPFLNNNNLDLQKLILDNYELLFKAEENKKMSILEYVKDVLLFDLPDYYNELLRIYKSLPIIDVEKSLSTIINYDKENILLELIKNRTIEYLDSGTTTRTFKVGEKVLKISKSKFFIDMDKDMFLLAPTETQIIYDNNNNPVLIIEIQDYLDRVHNGKEMKINDLYNYMEELDRQGYVTTDPLCLDYRYDNFGFLNNYKDANCSNPESLPDWFKERPIVMYDMDLVYKKDYPNKKYF